MVVDADSLRVDCLLVKPMSYHWGDEENFDKWLVVQPYEESDFVDSDSPEDWRENEEKTGFASYESMLSDNEPMMSYYYPLEGDFDEGDAKKISHTNLCLVGFNYDEGYALALTGGGMDFSWDICEAYIQLGFYPPVHFRLPRFAGMRATDKNLRIVDACTRGREIVITWEKNDIKDLERVREHLSELEPNSEKV
jgi:hypothetical protein